MGTQLPLLQKEQPPIFGPYLLWRNAVWMKMPLGMEVSLDQGDVVLDGDPDPPKGGGTANPTFQPISIVAKRLDGSGYHLVRW